MPHTVGVYVGEALGRYGFGHGHPFSPQRMGAFWERMRRDGLDRRVLVREPVQAEAAAIERFHARHYVEQVKSQSLSGAGYLDYGDTPAFPGVYEAAATVVGSALDAAENILQGAFQRAFVPIGGLHHARREQAAGFCVFNDCGVVIETLLRVHGLRRVAYVDIDAHHGDGVFYAFEDDPALCFVDFHEDGRYLYPGTGAASETGRGAAAGGKLNLPMPPGAGDADFRRAWDAQAQDFLERARPEFIVFQCGADSLDGDPLTHLAYTPTSHAYAAQRLCELADKHCQGRILGLGGGGYSLDNLAAAWCAVVEAFLA